MSPELHDILSKTKKVEEECDGVEQPESATNLDEVKCEEETPLQQQQDGEIQLKQQTVLKQDNEEEQPLQANAENATEENKVVQNDVQANEIEQKPEIREAEEKPEEKVEEKTEEVPSPKEEVKTEEVADKKEEEPKQEAASSPHEWQKHKNWTFNLFVIWTCSVYGKQFKNPIAFCFVSVVLSSAKWT